MIEELSTIHPLLPSVLGVIALLLAAVVADLLVKGVLVRGVRAVAKKSSATWDDKLLEFGVARDLTREEAERLTLSGDLLGSPSYMAPEQADPSFAPQGPHTDVYGLGAILYEAVTGAKVVEGETTANLLLALLKGKRQRPRERLEAIPEEVDDLVMRCLDLDPHARPADATALLLEIMQVRQRMAAPAAPPRPRDNS